MSDNEMLYCLIAFILGWLISRHMGNGFSVGGAKDLPVADPNTFATPDWLAKQAWVANCMRLERSLSLCKDEKCKADYNRSIEHESCRDDVRAAM